MKDQKILIGLDEYEKLMDIEKDLNRIKTETPFAIKIKCYNFYGNPHSEICVINKDNAILDLQSEINKQNKEIRELQDEKQRLLMDLRKEQGKSFLQKLWE